MIKKMLLVFAILLAASVGYSQEGTTDPQTTNPSPTGLAAPEKSTMQMTGVIAKIDLKNKSIKIKDEATNEATEYTFNEATTFNKQDLAIKVEDLKKGERLVFEHGDNKLLTRVVVEPKMSTTTTETPKPEPKE